MDKKRKELVDGLRAMASNAQDGTAGLLSGFLDKAADRIENDGLDLLQYAAKTKNDNKMGGCLFLMFLLSALLNVGLIVALAFK